jgi:hypothetical protein
MNTYQAKSDNLDAITTATGVVILAERVAATKGCTLPAGTYYFLLDRKGSLVESAHLQWSAALAATITVEASNYPEHIAGQPTQSPIDVSDYSAVAGEWVQLDPTTAYVPIVGAGNSVANLTITAGGANAGAAWIDMGNLGARRMRVKVVVTTQGVLRVGVNGRDGK